MSIGKLNLGLLGALTLLVASCGSNPDKEYIGLDLKKKLINEGQGVYVNGVGSRIEISSEGDFAMVFVAAPKELTITPSSMPNFSVGGLVDSSGDQRLFIQTPGSSRKQVSSSEVPSAMQVSEKTSFSLSCELSYKTQVVSLYAIPNEDIRENYTVARQLHEVPQYDEQATHVLNLSDNFLEGPGNQQAVIKQVTEEGSQVIDLSGFDSLQSAVSSYCSDMRVERPDYSRTISIQKWTSDVIQVGVFMSVFDYWSYASEDFSPSKSTSFGGATFTRLK